MFTAPASGEMESFEIRLPRWPLLLRLLGRAPLVRTTDRVEALVAALAVLVAMLAIPVAAAIGTAVHDSRSHLYTEQNETRRPVAATVSEVPAYRPFTRTGTVTVPVEWWDSGLRHTGAAQTQSSVAAGDPVEVWVGPDGTQVLAPAPVSRAAVEGVAAAVGIWLGVAAAAAAVCVTVRLMCARIRSTAWQHDLDSLVDGGGHTNSHP